MDGKKVPKIFNNMHNFVSVGKVFRVDPFHYFLINDIIFDSKVFFNEFFQNFLAGDVVDLREGVEPL